MVSINNSINNKVGGSNSGVTNTFTVSNSSNTASSQANEVISVGGGTAGDPFTTYTVTGAQTYSVGIDNSDSDNFKISGSTALGTTDLVTLDSSGQFALGAGNLFIRRSAAGATVATVINNTDNTNASSRAAIEMDSGGASGGDALVIFTNTSVTSWATGLDNSDSDKFKISASGSLGTNDVLSATTGGDVSTVLGNFDVTRSASGTTVSSTISNTSNTASSNALGQLTVGGSSAGDAFTTYTVSGVTNWSVGVDNSASDTYVIAASTALGTTDVMRSTVGGQVTLPLQSSFSAYASALVANVTGDGTNYTAIFDTEIQDINNDYNNSTGIFTAPVTGWYQFSGNAGIYNVGAGHTQCSLALVTTTNSYFQCILSPASIRASTNEVTLPFANTLYLTAGNTVKVVINVNNSTKTVGLRGNAATDIFVYFAGGLLN